MGGRSFGCRELVLLRVAPSLLWPWDVLLDTMRWPWPGLSPCPVETRPAETWACCPITMGLAWSLPVPVPPQLCPTLMVLPGKCALAALPCPGLLEVAPSSLAWSCSFQTAGIAWGSQNGCCGGGPHPTLLFWQDILKQPAQGSVPLGLECFNTSTGAGATDSL